MLYSTSKITLKELIKQGDYTQKRLAKKIGWSENWLSTQLNKPYTELSIGDIEKICSGMGVKIRIVIEE